MEELMHRQIREQIMSMEISQFVEQPLIRVFSSFMLRLLDNRMGHKESSDKLRALQKDSEQFILQVQSESEQDMITIVEEYFDQLTDIPNRCMQILDVLKTCCHQAFLNFVQANEDKDDTLILTISDMNERLEKIVLEHQKLIKNETDKAEKVIEDWKTLQKYYDRVFRESNKFQMKKNILDECF